MRNFIVDERLRFVSAFDAETGAYMRTRVLDDLWRDTGAEFFMASFPHLIDVVVPCSFDQGRRYAVRLGDGVDIEAAWNSPEFEAFRESLRRSCPACADRARCLGGCPLMPDVEAAKGAVNE